MCVDMRIFLGADRSGAVYEHVCRHVCRYVHDLRVNMRTETRTDMFAAPQCWHQCSHPQPSGSHLHPTNRHACRPRMKTRARAYANTRARTYVWTRVPPHGHLHSQRRSKKKDFFFWIPVEVWQGLQRAREQTGRGTRLQPSRREFSNGGVLVIITHGL